MSYEWGRGGCFCRVSDQIRDLPTEAGLLCCGLFAARGAARLGYRTNSRHWSTARHTCNLAFSLNWEIFFLQRFSSLTLLYFLAHNAPFYTILQKRCCASGIPFGSCIFLLLRVSAVSKDNLPDGLERAPCGSTIIACLSIFRYIQNLMEFGLQWKLFEYIFLLHCIILLLSWRFLSENNLLNWAAAVGRTHCRWMTSSFFPDPRDLIRRFGAERADLQFETSEERKMDRSKTHETSQKARKLLCYFAFGV